MKPTPKADECIRMIKDIENLNIIFNIKREPITDEVISGWGSKKDEFLQLDKDMFNNLLYWGKYYLILVNYRLFPFAQIGFKGNSSFKNYKGETIIKEFSDFADKHIKQTEKNILWQVLTEYDEVTSEDLKKEFWDIIPDLSRVQEYYNVMKMKYKDVFSEIPDKDYWDYFKLIKDDNFMAYYNSLIKYNIATQNEVETLIMKICNVVERLDMVISSIIGVYKGFLPAPPQANDYNANTLPTEQPPHFNADLTDEGLTATTTQNIINVESLKSYFNAHFKGMGNNENYFENNLIPDLQVTMTNRQIATVALVIYESRQMINKPSSFESWYTEFCKIMNVEKKTYKPSGLTPISQTIKNKFYYL